MENIYYVYIHNRNDTGEPFYVGKGHRRRAWSHSRSNLHWKRIVKKHGHSIEVVQDHMSESDAFLLEMWLIAKFKNDGIKLVNLTDGGEGVSGNESCETPVYSSTGDYYKSMADAARDMNRIGYKGASSTTISVACRRGKSLYNRAWSTNGVPDAPMHTDRATSSKESLRIGVYRSDGMYFYTMSDAASYIRETTGVKASPSHISNAVSGKRATAYGYSWSKHCIPDHLDITKYERKLLNRGRVGEMPVVCSNGMRFVSIAEAARWVNPENPRSPRSSICNCCKGNVKTAYGFVWRYDK